MMTNTKLDEAIQKRLADLPQEKKELVLIFLRALQKK